jgi:hypothetical protein
VICFQLTVADFLLWIASAAARICVGVLNPENHWAAWGKVYPIRGTHALADATNTRSFRKHLSFGKAIQSRHLAIRYPARNIHSLYYDNNNLRDAHTSLSASTHSWLCRHIHIKPLPDPLLAVQLNFLTAFPSRLRSRALVVEAAFRTCVSSTTMDCALSSQ